MARSVRHGVYLRHAVCATNEKQRWRAREVKGLEPYRRVLRDGAETGRLSSSSRVTGQIRPNYRKIRPILREPVKSGQICYLWEIWPDFTGSLNIGLILRV